MKTIITTIDGLKRHKGDKVWEIGISEDGYRPTLSIVEGRNNRLANPDRCWDDYAKCLNECEKLNENPALELK